MQASSSAWRTPCHVDRNPSNGSVGFVAVIAWMTSSRALGRREKETSRDICGAMRAGTSLGLATAAVEHTSFKTAAVTIVLEKNPWSHTQPTAQDLQFFFPFSVLEVVLPLAIPTWPAMHVAPAPTPNPCLHLRGAWPCAPPHQSGRCCSAGDDHACGAVLGKGPIRDDGDASSFFFFFSSSGLRRSVSSSSNICASPFCASSNLSRWAALRAGITSS